MDSSDSEVRGQEEGLTQKGPSVADGCECPTQEADLDRLSIESENQMQDEQGEEGRMKNGGAVKNMNGHAVNDDFVDIDINEEDTNVRDWKGEKDLGGRYEPELSDDEHVQDEDGKVPEPEVKMVGTFELFRFADRVDIVLMLVGTLAAIAFGCGFPVNLIIYGEAIDNFLAKDFGNALGVNETNRTYHGKMVDDLTEVMKEFIIYFCVLGCAVMVVGFIAIWMWTWTAERQTNRIRKLFFSTIMRQHIGWFDQQQVGDLTTRLAEDVNNIQNGMGDKVATFLHYMATFVAGLVLGFVRGWKLTLVIISVCPLIAVSIIFLLFFLRLYSKKEASAYAAAGAIADEVLSSIRTVAAFGGEKKEVERYGNNLSGARALGIKKGFITGIGQGLIQLSIFSTFALASWYGSKLSRDEGYTGGRVLQVFLSVMVASMSFGNAAPNLEVFATARGAAAKVYAIIGLESEIDSSSDEGEKPDQIEGKVRFEDVKFSYPARSDVQILKGLSLEVNVGETVALVGSSGCGKSTTVQLLQRFYDPAEGSVKIGGYDIRDLNVHYLRQMIGVVSQEPVLFATTIAENISYGREGVTQTEIEQAAKEANAHNFICQLPQKYETLVGERGTQLSGGQKQRIAIARALVRNPRILLLDEATSALDTESEAIVQDALDKVRRGRTTIVIAHRLSTIKTADHIIGIDDGQVVENGTHEQLMEKEGLYYQLVMNQSADDKKKVSLNMPGMLTGGLAKPVVGFTSLPNDNYTESQASELDDEASPDEPLLEKIPSLRRAHSSRRSSRGSRHSLQQQMSSKSTGSVWSKKDEDAEAKKLPPATISRIMRLNSPEVPHIILGTLGSLVVGAINPVFAVILSEIVGNFAQPDLVKQSKNASLYSGVIFGVAVFTGICSFLSNTLFAITGENLTMRLRKMAFSAMVRQDMTYFDDHRNQVGALTARLATDASAVRGAAGSSAGLLAQSISNMGTAVVIAFIFGWKLALVVLCFLPIVMLSGIIQGRMQSGNSTKNEHALEEGAKIATEAIENIRTVASLTKEQQFQAKYNEHFDGLYRQGRRKAVVFGFFYGLSQGVIFFIYAATYGYGSKLIDDGEMNFTNVFRVFAAITFGGMAMGRASSLSPDYSKAKLAAAKIFALLDTVPSIDAYSSEGAKPTSCEGNIHFEGVQFRYPTRPDSAVLKGLDFRIKKGQTVALVGSSGCGKSTSIQLMERFYDTLAGCVKIDDTNLKDLNVEWLRSQMGLVSQEPVLFDLSIKENIAYGDNSREVSIAEVIEAAKKANIHNFITSLPKGYETAVGEKGTQLSGGQKQRVAIARALIRNPKILLLDEATSALDTESEKVVQEALDHAMAGRTSIVIAHRLSTIRNADKIVVIDSGRVTEAGTHAELMEAEGLYYKLHQVQNRKRAEKAE